MIPGGEPSSFHDPRGRTLIFSWSQGANPHIFIIPGGEPPSFHDQFEALYFSIIPQPEKDVPTYLNPKKVSPFLHGVWKFWPKMANLAIVSQYPVVVPGKNEISNPKNPRIPNFREFLGRGVWVTVLAPLLYPEKFHTLFPAYKHMFCEEICVVKAPI